MIRSINFNDTFKKYNKTIFLQFKYNFYFVHKPKLSSLKQRYKLLQWIWRHLVTEFTD